MNYRERFRVLPGASVKLKDIDAAFKDHHENHKEARKRSSATKRGCANFRSCSMRSGGTRS